ncbi:DNA translocase FtsK [Pediococcus claussenii]|uniref:DNA translocase FtsK n=1 Tax=Pediococcus claussenii (strain ATCC BAA-344 / DSM 14800 / JCM 18046 / KCTC 3811 / LMG 21948 / P06) TaxID=701521 RepID=G8PDS3_PEDCP|nr:DNA translocase FtsK [Pediococcus claussenii]AEV95408.1 DNA translocase sftA [Pediococcus claussenii ATCC BAA-344]ANZ68938.1 cell division protein FtsK [Pediococcus claussenii]ANZ70754.1 cell division protein FtsK [Pediococcus claussenii]KRN19051.1 sftA protein [Pediococcus claussenii]
MGKYDGPAFFRKKKKEEERLEFKDPQGQDQVENGLFKTEKKFKPAIDEKEVKHLKKITRQDKTFQENKQGETSKFVPRSHLKSESMPRESITRSESYPAKELDSRSDMQSSTRLDSQSISVSSQLTESSLTSGEVSRELSTSNFSSNHRRHRIFEEPTPDFDVEVPKSALTSNQVDEHSEMIRGYNFPKVSMLPDPIRTAENTSEWVKDLAQRLNDALSAFGVNASVANWTVGPTVTQFEIELGRGVKVNKITNLADDLKLQLAARDIRIEAPIPGKSTVGIEVPNLKSRPVLLSEIIDSDAFRNSESPLTVAIGVDLFGQPRVYDLRKMPHGLIAGATGSGKSVFINSLLVSLLYKATPKELRLLLIDPKAVELAPYNNLPHLLSPVISDPKAASAALKWVTKEMDQRYEKLAAAGARNIEQFNKKAEKVGDDANKMPYIVVIIDELADLMMVASSEVQDYIVRITQKARAAGIHLIIATQRPSVDVVTGLIKNNIPTRVAFMVSSQIDSRTILDHAGAERLLGRGDMLFLGNGASRPVRLQGAYIEDEIDEITEYVRGQAPPQYMFNPTELKEAVAQTDNSDELMGDVLKYIANEDTVSTSKLQRMFSIGYNRAATMIDQLEELGYVSEARGSKPRDVYYSGEEENKK